MGGGDSERRQVGEREELGVDGLSGVAMIGSGGSSTVYRATQDALDREVAIKVVHAAWTMETRERFEHERELMGRLSGHTAIVPIFETGITKRGEPYLLMPFYERGSLFRLMRERGPLPFVEATFLVEDLAATVADCHRDGIVHRDIKPGNVLLTRHLHPRLTDFGIALPLGLATPPSTVAYTPSYGAPEAFEPGQASAALDVYGLGATLWALLAGRSPNSEPGESVDPTIVRKRALAGPPGRPHPTTPDALADLLDRTMDPDPDRRPPDAAALVAELRRASRSDGARPGPIPRCLPQPERPKGRADTEAVDGGRGGDRLWLAMAALVVVGLALVVAGAVALLS